MKKKHPQNEAKNTTKLQKNNKKLVKKSQKVDKKAARICKKTLQKTHKKKAKNQWKLMTVCMHFPNCDGKTKGRCPKKNTPHIKIPQKSDENDSQKWLKNI